MIGFSEHLDEVQELRRAYSELNDVARNIREIRKRLNQEDWRMADAHVRAAEWHAEQAKAKIAIVGQAAAKKVI